MDNDKKKKRLKAVLKHPDNQRCSECGEPRPTWGVLLEPPVKDEGAKKLGCLCCFQCYRYHFKLGPSVCSVKSVNMVSEWTNEDIDILQAQTNQQINAIYEHFLPYEYNVDTEKQDMQVFVQQKYVAKKYFNEQLYQQHTTVTSLQKQVEQQPHGHSRRTSATVPRDRPTTRDRRTSSKSRSSSVEPLTEKQKEHLRQMADRRARRRASLEDKKQDEEEEEDEGELPRLTTMDTTTGASSSADKAKPRRAPPQRTRSTDGGISSGTRRRSGTKTPRRSSTGAAPNSSRSRSKSTDRGSSGPSGASHRRTVSIDDTPSPPPKKATTTTSTAATSTTTTTTTNTPYVSRRRASCSNAEDSSMIMARQSSVRFHLAKEHTSTDTTAAPGCIVHVDSSSNHSRSSSSHGGCDEEDKDNGTLPLMMTKDPTFLKNSIMKTKSILLANGGANAGQEDGLGLSTSQDSSSSGRRVLSDVSQTTRFYMEDASEVIGGMLDR